MPSLVTRINITLPTDLVLEFRKIIPEKTRSGVIAAALAREIEKIKRGKAIEKLSGVWDKSGGFKFSNDDDLLTWRKNLWRSWDKKLDTND